MLAQLSLSAPTSSLTIAGDNQPIASAMPLMAAPSSVVIELAGMLWAAHEQAVAKDFSVHPNWPRAATLLRPSFAFEKKASVVVREGGLATSSSRHPPCA